MRDELKEAARALLAVVDGREKGLRGYYIDAKRFDALRAALALPADAPEGAGEAVRALVKAVDGMLDTIASSVPRDAPFSFMLTRDVAEVSRAIAALEAAAAKEGV